MAKAPTGVSVLSLLLILVACLNINSLQGAMYYGVLYFAYVGLFAMFGIIVGISLLLMKPWARKVAIVFEFINVVGSTASFFMIYPLFGMIMLMAMIPGILIALVVILYLMQPSIKAAFEGPVMS
jgi:hypothetical protein